MPAYVPDTGDIVWVQFTPQAGHEQAGHRPALVLTPASYNRLRGMMICCPMTTKAKGYAFEVKAQDGSDGVILADQVKSIDWRARKASFKGKATVMAMAEVRAKLRPLLGF